jgi:hypothetical protein
MTALFYLGLVVALVGGIWLLVVTFKKSVWWGLGSLFIPLVGLIFVIMNWELTKKPFLIYLAGVVVTVIAAMNMPEIAAQMPV